MKTPERKILIGAALALTGLAAPALLYQSSACLRADDSSTVVHLTGTLDSVDADGAHAVFVTDSGLRYTLDTAHPPVALQPGMRVQVAGEPLSDGTIQADQIQVLASGDGPIPERVRTPAPVAPSSSSDVIHLRGTVVSADQAHGSLVVRVNDHTRTVFVDDSTVVSQEPSAGQAAAAVVPLNLGDRVTVSGIIRPDGTVVADTLQVGAAAPQGVDLTGAVVQPSNRYYTRDIKIRVADGREVTVHVPSDTTVVRGGQPISVHALSNSDVVRVEGIPDGDDVQATRIEVVSAGGKNF